MRNPFARDRSAYEMHTFRIRRARPKWVMAWGVVGGALMLVVGGGLSYFAALTPVDTGSDDLIRVLVQEGQGANSIAQTLQDQGLIRSKEAFGLYTQLSGTKSQLQAGGYLLKKSYSVQEIVQHLIAGKTDEMKVTILPGLTLKQLADPAVPGSLAQQGFTQAEITSAFGAAYDSPLFTGKPATASLEGYIYPETYKIAASSGLAPVLQMTFDEFYRVIQEKGIVAGLQKQNLSLYQGITLASIVQKEVSSPTDQPQVAQVFLKRLKDNMVLGSDVTFLYIAAKEGRTPSVDDPSPYNTRRAAGLPPGPIANFNLSALQAVINPAPGDYVYFVAGDDGTTHFARTEAEHNANVAKYCHTLCSQ